MSEGVAFLRRMGGALREDVEDVPSLLQRLGSAVDASAVMALRPTRRAVVADCAWRENRWERLSVTVHGLDASALARLTPIQAVLKSAEAAGIDAGPTWDAGRALTAPFVLGLSSTPSRISERTASLVATAVEVVLTRQHSAAMARRNSLVRERARIASAIHQGASQELATVTVQLEVLEELLRQNPEGGRELVSEIRASTRRAMASLRAAILDLAPAVPDSSSLVEGLKHLVENFRDESGADVSFAFEGEAQTIGSDALSLVFTFVHEALTNLRKYSTSRRGEVQVSCDDELLRASVKDEGQVHDRDVSELPGHGLSILWGRAQLLGGEMQIEHSPDEGTNVVLEIPI